MISLGNKISEYQSKCKEIEELWYNCEEELMAVYKALGRKIYKVDGAELIEIDVDNKICKVKFFYSDWNSYDSDDVHIPWEILESENPVQKAKDIVAERNSEIQKIKAQKEQQKQIEDLKRRKELYKKLKEEFEK